MEKNLNFLDRNEFNYSPSKEVVEALKNFDINKLCFYTRIYDEGKKSILSVFLSELYDIDETQVLLGYGGEDILKQQYNIFIILNGIANNPTGYCMSVAEWQSAVDVPKEATKDETKNAILIADVAYLDYSGEKEECREFFKVFGGLPKNILDVCAYTLSKVFTMYCQRMGAMIGISSDKDVIKEYVDINQ